MKIDEIIVKDRIRKDTGGMMELINDIKSWVPECSYDGYTGTKAYIKYLNEMRNA